MEQKLLAAALNDQDACLELSSHVTEETFTPEGKLIFDAAVGFYQTDPTATKVDRDLLVEGFKRQIQSSKLLALLTTTLKGIPSDVSVPNVLKELKEHRLYVLSNQIAAHIGRNGDSADLDDLIYEYQRIKDSSGELNEVGEESFNQVSIGSLVKTEFDKSAMIEIWPPVLNENIDGGARRGHHILVFAPTEMGKTLFAINMVAGFLKNGHKVLYVGNEDPAADILMRAATRLTGMNKHEIMAKPDVADKLLSERNWHLFTLVAMAPGNFTRINRLCESGDFDVVIIDQLRNLDVRGGNRTESLEKAATEARNLARKQDVLVVSITQAADSASGKRVLNRGDVDSSNVGIPGQCDLMIGIGAEQAMEDNNMRCISMPKNKLSGKHIPIMVQIDPTISKVLT